MRVIDVDADEDRSCDRGADACGLGEAVAVIVMARFPSLLGWPPDGCPTVSRMLGTGVALAHHHMM